MTYETVIGLEVHLQLDTATKAFCGCSTEFGQKPNSQTCPVCLGLPGSLPVLNEKAFLFAIKVALALNCGIQDLIKFDRKNYYYPDLPKNYQISQYDMPLAYDGYVDIPRAGAGEPKRIRILRVHLEEDAGKLMHAEGGEYSLIDLNRTGVPLLEIVTKPDISSPQEAYDYLTKLKSILEYLRVSDCDMEKGSLRCDANVSIRPAGETKLGTKIELKNMNTFKGVKASLEYEVKRQTEALDGEEKLFQETRLWDADKMITIPMRTKEEATDYRYFPEPDLVPFMADKSLIEDIRRGLPELPEAKVGKFMKDYGLSEYDSNVLALERDVAEYFEECANIYENRKAAANWITGDIMAYLKTTGASPKELGVPPKELVELLRMIDKGAISGKMAKEALADAINMKVSPAKIIAEKGMSQISDTGKLEEAVRLVISKNQKSVNDYKSGKVNAFGYLVGQVMRDTKGAANPEMVNRILKKALER
ncbi:MAG: Asp-tRNA(Asn)/Glu-tRNA(Gln) amidotransferase subunit GatB [Candidatus Omnitrophota bacterium]